MRQQTSSQLLDAANDELAHQLHGKDGSASSLQGVPVRTQGAPCPGSIGQHDVNSAHVTSDP